MSRRYEYIVKPDSDEYCVVMLANGNSVRVEGGFLSHKEARDFIEKYIDGDLEDEYFRTYLAKTDRTRKEIQMLSEFMQRMTAKNLAEYEAKFGAMPFTERMERSFERGLERGWINAYEHTVERLNAILERTAEM